MKHTPGGWTVVQECSNSLNIVAAGEKLVAQIIQDEDIPDDDCVERANAKLIAAAPELLETIKRADYLITGQDYLDARKVLHDALKKLGCTPATKVVE